MGLVDLYSFSGGGEFRFTGDWRIMSNINGKGNESLGGRYFGLTKLTVAHW
jgi:hypothetical protein